MSRPRETESPPDSPSEDEDAASNLEHATRRSISSDSTLSSDPANKDAALNETIVGSPTKEDVELWDADQASFIRSDCGLKGQWVGKRPLGKGAFGRAGLWVKVNDNGRIIDHIVVKEFTGGNKGKFKPKVPKEVKIMNLMKKTQCRAVVRLKKYRRYLHQQCHRLYMEYCPYGDLKLLIDRYRRFRAYLPEPFLWEVFYYLVEVAVAMRDGPPDGHWNFQVVHLDIKPENVFLAEKNSDIDGVPYYPSAKLGDFGLARMTEPLDPNNPAKLYGMGTEQRPEFWLARKIKDKAPYRILSHTDVWGIGATMYELMTLRRVNTVTFRDVEDPHYSINKITTSRNPEYSSHLRDTVRDCLIIKPWKRTRIDELRSNVKNYRDIIHKEMFSHATIRTTPPAPRPDERLYYIDNEMKDMPPGDWRPNSGEREKNPQKPDRKYRDPEIPSIPFHHFPDAVFESSQEKAKEVLSAKNKNKHILDKWSSTSRDNEEAEEGSEGGSDDDDSDDSGHPSRKRKRGDTGHNENNQSKSLGLDSRVGLHSQGSLDGSVDAGDRHHSSVEAESANEEEATGVGPESEDQSITQNRRRYRGHERRPFAVPSVTEGSGETNETSSSDDEDIEVQDEEESGVEEDAESATDEEEEETDDEDDPPAKRRSRATRFEEDSYDDGPGDVDDDEPSVTFGRRKPRAPL